jgi:hypothetical protein
MATTARPRKAAAANGTVNAWEDDPPQFRYWAAAEALRRGFLGVARAAQ